MRLVPPDDVRAADARAADLGVPTARLMQAAGRAVADAIEDGWPGARTLFLCGRGDNGGDGYVAAAMLSEDGRSPRVLALDPDASKGDAAETARAEWRARHPLETLDLDTLQAALSDTDLVVDALFGSGLDRPLRGDVVDIVRHLASWNGPILAVDVPSGIDAGSAVPPGEHVVADRTVQLAWACPASALSPARFAFGDTTVADIGMPDGALEDRPHPYLVDDDAIDDWPAPAPDVHKYRVGSVLIAAGSPRWSGAAELCCRGAHRAGAGLVTLLTDAAHPDRWPETIVLSLDESSGALSQALGEAAQGVGHARVFGPGLDPERVPELAYALETASVPTILDATALDPRLRRAVAAQPDRWLTPHHGEAARLLAWTTDEVHRDPIGAARALSQAWACGVVLKSAGAVIVAPDDRVRIVAAGDPAVASGGTGDVLAGVLGAALAAPHDDPLDRVCAAVQAHARAGEVAALRLGRGVRASDVANALPLVLDGLPGRPMGTW